MSDAGYAEEKFWEAMNCLIGSGTLSARLIDAAKHLTMLEKHDLSLEVADEFRALYRRNGLFQRAFEIGAICTSLGCLYFVFSVFLLKP